MNNLRQVTPWFAALAALTCAGAEACSVHVHYTKSELEAADLRHYERDVAARDSNVFRFDKLHPLAGQLLGDQQFYEKELHAWQAHPGCFDSKYPCLSELIQGELIYDKRHPQPPVIVPVEAISSIPGSVGGSSPPTQGQDSGGNPGGGSQTPGGGVQTASVPEPSSGVLILTGMVVALIAASHRAIVRRMPPARH